MMLGDRTWLLGVGGGGGEGTANLAHKKEKK